MTRPNVLVVCADDLGYGDLGCYGSDIPTPNLDRLATESVRLTDWHANGPICSPTRASLLTGKYPQRAGMPGNGPEGHPATDPDDGLPTDQSMLATLLGDAGYRTGAFGKWHLGMTDDDDPLAAGFEEFFGIRSGCVDYYSHLQVWLQSHGIPPYHDLWDDRTEIRRNGAYLPHLITERAREFIDGETPFFAYVAYNTPHYPLHFPPRYADRVSHLEGERARHGAMVSVLDEGIGRLLDGLEDANVDEETIVVFTSDHGPSREIRNHLDGSTRPYRGGSAGQYRGHKFSLFEGGIRIPGIVRYPSEIDGGWTSGELGTTMDLLPTVADYCGIDLPEDCDGHSLRPVLSAGATTPHDRVYWEFRDQAAVRDGDWKLVVDGIEIPPDADTDVFESVDGPHLTNLSEDPGERTDLTDEHPRRATDLASDLREWQTSVG
ncbi:sulfatase-like hydrolase/transferase [Halorhabdus amylolytica]|uniref:sulfatase-like hydrolase/transferase n=1 Tax=Halorhabdus amylolytica TaxID=2559573 RepID=UPI0010A9C528|nr:sulfatase-like hydrolase/transferase [Halorhabdus amylolytica]